ncbi:YbdK family carboxylate-amine ligase [Streptomyces sp. NPDC006208]|uniref:carboxylate-amine ligase n=1 Tax=Streptomyces sp. NPDC006208 TaxID=3156734 RepID=UPI0033A07BB9
MEPPTDTAGGFQVLTMGVEEEFFLVDRHSRAPVPRAPPVIARAAAVLGEQVQAEFYRSMVEVCTNPTASSANLRAQMTALRGAVVGAARDAGCLLLASGTPVVPPSGPIPVTDKPRCRRMEALFRAAVDGRDGPTCGCHIHVGSIDRSQALDLTNGARPWLPTLQALAVNSPFSGGRDTGFASRRAIRSELWPTTEPPPVLSRTAYEATADALVTSGILLDRRSISWYARPSEHVPTLEIRIADVNADLDTALLIAVLTRGLCTALLPGVQDGRPPPHVPPGLLRAAHRRAARLGSTGLGIDPLTGAEVPMRQLIEGLAARAAPGLCAASDLALARQLLDRHHAFGSGADRQRARHLRTGSLNDVVDHLAVLTAGAGDPLECAATYGVLASSCTPGRVARP